MFVTSVHAPPISGSAAAEARAAANAPGETSVPGATRAAAYSMDARVNSSSLSDAYAALSSWRSDDLPLCASARLANERSARIVRSATSARGRLDDVIWFPPRFYGRY